MNKRHSLFSNLKDIEQALELCVQFTKGLEKDEFSNNLILILREFPIRCDVSQ